MTDRIHALTVVLERDIRDDDIQPVIEAIKMVRCVADVKPHVADHVLYTAESRAHQEFAELMYKLLRVSGDSRRKKLLGFLNQLIEEGTPR